MNCAYEPCEMWPVRKVSILLRYTVGGLTILGESNEMCRLPDPAVNDYPHLNKLQAHCCICERNHQSCALHLSQTTHGSLSSWSTRLIISGRSCSSSRKGRYSMLTESENDRVASSCGDEDEEDETCSINVHVHSRRESHRTGSAKVNNNTTL